MCHVVYPLDFVRGSGRWLRKRSELNSGVKETLDNHFKTLKNWMSNV